MDIISISVWISNFIFGAYILSIYVYSLFNGNQVNSWNRIFKLYSSDDQTANFGMGLHFLCGGLISILGNIQLLSCVRKSYLSLHKWMGRVYLLLCVLVSLGGLLYIIKRGTVGGTMMNVGFGCNGLLMLYTSYQTWYCAARLKNIVKHREWALRLYALAVSSWIYRVEYSIWLFLTGGLWHTMKFDGYFDYFMDFAFYIPNLIFVELYIRGHKDIFNQYIFRKHTVFIIVFFTLSFIKYMWIPSLRGEAFAEPEFSILNIFK